MFFFWIKASEKYLDKVSVSYEKDVVNFLNSRFVAERHNTYSFYPDLPDYLEKIKRIQEKFYEISKSPLESLGRLYGSIAQNYGFCGPKYLNLCEKYVRLAQFHFGDGKILHLKNHWQREFAYLFFAYLDSKLYSFAEKSLFSYLGIKFIDEAKTICNKSVYPYNFYKHALLRFISETMSFENTIKEFVFKYKKCLEKIFLFESFSHPYQLIFYNLGKIFEYLGDLDRAKEAYEKSIEICLKINTETTLPMSLLGFSKLFKIKKLSMSDQKNLKKVLKFMASKDCCLNKKHFFPVLELSSIEEVLKEIESKEANYFPFSYR